MIQVVGQRGFKMRLLGLMFKKELPEDVGYLFKNCRNIHTCFMRIPIDIYGLNESGKVVQVFYNVKSNRMILFSKQTKHVIESKAGVQLLTLNQMLELN